MIVGHCLCGAVQYAVAAPFEYAGYCHCSRCRAASGSAFAAFAGVGYEHLRITAGVDAMATYRRNADVTTHLCRHCGSVLYLLVRAARYAHIQMGTLQGDPGIRPQFHMYVDSRAPWHEITDDLPRFAALAGAAEGTHA
ncbi:MAG TPA: GFA family protein [Lysobacter sp.]